MDVARILERISPSGFDCFSKCEALWGFRYVDGIRTPPSAVMAAGRGFDGVTNDFYLERVAFRQHMLEEEVRDSFATHYRKETAEVESWGGMDRGKLLDRGIAATVHWRANVALYVEPVLVQPRIEQVVEFAPEQAEANDRLGIRNGCTLTGFADAVVDLPWSDDPLDRIPHRAVIDHKLSGKAWGDADVLRETQPVVYALALGQRTFQYHVARRDLVQPRIDILTRKIGRRDVEGLLNRYAITRRKIAAAIQSGDFLPNRKSMLCSRRWCGMWERCEKRFGGTVPA